MVKDIFGFQPGQKGGNAMKFCTNTTCDRYKTRFAYADVMTYCTICGKVLDDTISLYPQCPGCARHIENFRWNYCGYCGAGLLIVSVSA